MNSLSTLFSEVKYLKNASIIKIFRSKKHTVALIENEENHFVLKWYKQGFKESFLQECTVLKERNTLFLKPGLVSMNNDYQFLVLEYIPSENICDLINDPTTQIQDKLSCITHLASWFYQFHNYYQQQSKPLIHGDANLRNFIISQNKNVFGLDFEESKPGNVNEDIAFLCASILTTNPTFTKQKHQLQRQFVNKYEKLINHKLEDIDVHIDQAVVTINERRRKNLKKD